LSTRRGRHHVAEQSLIKVVSSYCDDCFELGVCGLQAIQLRVEWDVRGLEGDQLVAARNRSESKAYMGVQACIDGARSHRVARASGHPALIVAIGYFHPLGAVTSRWAHSRVAVTLALRITEVTRPSAVAILTATGLQGTLESSTAFVSYPKIKKGKLAYLFLRRHRRCLSL
jgi:hypothetical protein